MSTWYLRRATLAGLIQKESYATEEPFVSHDGVPDPEA